MYSSKTISIVDEIHLVEFEEESNWSSMVVVLLKGELWNTCQMMITKANVPVKAIVSSLISSLTNTHTKQHK